MTLMDRGNSSRGRRRPDWIGESFTWLCGGALAFNLLMIVAVLLLIGYHGLEYFWQKDLTLLTLDDGTRILGEIEHREARPSAGGGKHGGKRYRIQLKVGNRDVTGSDFVWIDEDKIRERTRPANAVVLERMEWGNFYGTMVALMRQNEVLAKGSAAVWRALGPLHARKVALRERIRKLEKNEIGDINYEIEQLRLARRRLDLKKLPEAEARARKAALENLTRKRKAEYQVLAGRLLDERRELEAEKLVMETAAGERKEIPVGDIVRALRPNDMGLVARTKLYLDRIGEFIWRRST
jgi:phosphate transport system permease protein